MINTIYIKGCTSLKKCIAGIECRGTKINFMVAKVTRHILARATLATKSPELTFPYIINWLNSAKRKKHFELVGFRMGAGGSITHDPASAKLTYSRRTPKPGWTAVEIIKHHSKNFPVSVFH